MKLKLKLICHSSIPNLNQFKFPSRSKLKQNLNHAWIKLFCTKCYVRIFCFIYDIKYGDIMLYKFEYLNKNITLVYLALVNGI